MKYILPVLLLMTTPSVAAPLGDIADFRHCVGKNCVDEWYRVYSADEIRAMGAVQYCFVGIRVWFDRIGPEDWKRRGRDEAFLLVDDCKKLHHMRPEQAWNHPNPALDRAEGMDHSKYTARQWCWYSDAHCAHGQRYLNEVKK
jgi:hypothetical protein